MLALNMLLKFVVELLRLSLKMSTFFSWLISTSNSTTFLPLRMKCQLLWQWFGTKLWIMDFYWIIGLDISSSFQLSRQLNRDGLNIFLLGFELNAHISYINLESKKVLETTESSFWNDVAVFQEQGKMSLLCFSDPGSQVGFHLLISVPGSTTSTGW